MNKNLNGSEHHVGSCLATAITIFFVRSLPTTAIIAGSYGTRTTYRHICGSFRRMSAAQPVIRSLFPFVALRVHSAHSLDTVNIGGHARYLRRLGPYILEYLRPSLPREISTSVCHDERGSGRKKISCAPREKRGPERKENARINRDA